jgi:hypothetical protein
MNQQLKNVQIISLPQSLDTQFEESDFFELFTSICNYDAKYGITNKDFKLVVEDLRPKKVMGIL